jgi:uncharacterized Zn finger protein (UPF0148 family)
MEQIFRKCPKCGIELLMMDKDGKHNFCPSSEAFSGRIVEICMKCKMEEVVAKWENP